MKKLFLISVIVLFFIVFYSTACEKLVKEVKQEARKKYLTEWVKANLLQESVLKSIGPLGRVTSRDHNKLFKEFDFNWSIFNVDEIYAGIHIHRNLSDYSDFLNTKNIKSVSFSDGRNRIFVKMNGSKTFGGGFDKEASKFTKVSDFIWVYCY